MYAAITCQSHQMHCFAALSCIAESVFNLGIILYGALFDGLVDLDKILIDDATGSYVEMSHLRVAHLTVGETDVFAAGL